MNDILLQMNHIGKSYSGNVVLRDISIGFRRGEVHALMGENGAGKSTLMKIITGVVHPETGDMVYDGKPLVISHPKEMFELGIGIVYQEFNLMPDLTVAQNIFIGREPQKKRTGFSMIGRPTRMRRLFLLNSNAILTREKRWKS